MKTAIIAINIINNKRLLNPSGTPILLYWDGKQDIEELLLTDEFTVFISKLCFNCSNYASSKISTISYYDDTDIENDEVHDIRTFDIQDLYLLSKYNNVADKLLFETIHELYINIFKHSYDKQDIDGLISEIRSHEGDKFSSQSILNFVRSKTETLLKLNDDNYKVFIEKTKLYLNLTSK